MYKIIFNDDTEFIGGEYNNSKWNEIPNKPIKKISYNLLNHTIIFEEYEAYNHLVEKVQFILNNNQAAIGKIFLMAKKNNIVYTIIFDLFNKKIYQETYEFGKEYYGGSTSGWKQGILSENPIYKIN
jgi:hypothetical protein